MQFISTRYEKKDKVNEKINMELLDQLNSFIINNGPRPDEYRVLDALFEDIQDALVRNQIDRRKLNDLLKYCECLNDVSSIAGHLRLQPFGYPGDHLISDRIYTSNASGLYRDWDNYVLMSPAMLSLRNRIRYFQSCVNNGLLGGEKLLVLGSGPGRELYNHYSDNVDSKMEATCVEMEEKAISYSRRLNESFESSIYYVPMNVFRYETIQTYDFIWSARLFDFLSDDAYVTLLRKCRKWLKPDGKIVIANFNQNHHPGRAFLEILCDWNVNYRTREHLISLAIEAGYHKKRIAVDSEPDNVNLYLKISV